MAFLDVRFPPLVALQAVGGPTYNTSIVAVRSGKESRNENWSRARIRLTFTHHGLFQAQHDELLNLFHAAAGTAHSFRVKNWFDYQITQTASGFAAVTADTIVGAYGFGYGEPTYQLFKQYQSGSYTRDKIITKLVLSTVYRNGIAVTVGAGAGEIALNDLTGRASFVADQTRSISSHTVGSVHQITLASAFSPNMVAGGRIYITGVTGTAAALLNDMSHEIPGGGIAGAVINIGVPVVNTTGLTASGGNAFFYPQPTETLTIAGEFDIPMRFTSDEANIESVDKNLAEGLIYQWTGIDLIEVRDE